MKPAAGKKIAARDDRGVEFLIGIAFIRNAPFLKVGGERTAALKIGSLGRQATGLFYSISVNL
jgi:hypothetical protein